MKLVTLYNNFFKKPVYLLLKKLKVSVEISAYAKYNRHTTDNSWQRMGRDAGWDTIERKRKPRNPSWNTVLDRDDRELCRTPEDIGGTSIIRGKPLPLIV